MIARGKQENALFCLNKFILDDGNNSTVFLTYLIFIRNISLTLHSICSFNAVKYISDFCFTCFKEISSAQRSFFYLLTENEDCFSQLSISWDCN